MRMFTRERRRASTGARLRRALLVGTGVTTIALLAVSAIDVGPASAQTAPPTLNGEQLQVFGVVGCPAGSVSGPFSFTVSGAATGPYSGPFSETVNAAVDSSTGTLTSYTATFTITSGAGDVTGTETLTPAGSSQSFACLQDSSNWLVLGLPDYQATIHTSGGDYSDQGTTFFQWGAGQPFSPPVAGFDLFTSSQTQTTLIDPTSTSVACSPATVAVGQPSTCTATVTDTASSGQTTPTGTVTVGSSGPGNFTGSPCTLTETSTGVATCQVTYTPGASGTPTRADTITASYNPDLAHMSSSGTTTVTVQPTTIGDCLHGGWQNYGFANQGLCIRFVETGR
jgi:hypothetical protein